MKKGIYLVLITALISGFANFFNKMGMEALGKDAYQYTFLKNAIVALVLSAAILTPLLWPKLKQISKSQWLKLVLIGLIGGSIPFLLFFKGLSMTSAVSASFIHKTLFIWVAILAVPFLKEKVTKLQFLALAVLFGSGLLFGGFKSFTWTYAHTLVLLATLFWAVENVIAKKVLKNVDALVVAWGRMFFGSLLLLGFLAFTGNTNGLLEINGQQWLWLILVSAFLTGYVVTWYGALKILPATTVSAFLVLAAPVTALLNGLFVAHKLPVNDLWRILIMAAALAVLWRFSKRENYGLEFKQA